MPIIKLTYRVPGGKTIRVCIEWEDGLLKNVVFTGDFFMQPDYLIDELGESLSGVRISRDEIIKAISEFFKKHQDIWIYGAKPEDFAKAVLKALKID